MICVTVMVVGVVYVIPPFLKLTVLAYSVGSDLLEFSSPFLDRFRVNAESGRGRNGVGKDLACYGESVGGAFVGGAVFGRI